MKEEEYWKLFWLSGMPEAWLMSRPGMGSVNAADMAAEAVPPTGEDLPREAAELRLREQEQKQGGMT